MAMFVFMLVYVVVLRVILVCSPVCRIRRAAKSGSSASKIALPIHTKCNSTTWSTIISLRHKEVVCFL